MLTRAVPLSFRALGLLVTRRYRRRGRRARKPALDLRVRGIYFRPDLAQFSTFYGDDHQHLFRPRGNLSIARPARARRRVRLMKERGVGVLTDSGALGGSVEYRLDPSTCSRTGSFSARRRSASFRTSAPGSSSCATNRPSTCRPTIEGRTDPGWSARAGVRFQIASVGPVPRSSSTESSYWRSYMFVEAQRMSAKVDGQNLGGDVFVLGFRMEFNFH